MLFPVGVDFAFADSSQGKILYRQAQGLEKNADYFKALESYKEANVKLEKEGNAELLKQCRNALTRMEKICLIYTLTEEDVRNRIKEKYPDTTDARINEIIKEGRLPQLIIGGKTYYFEDCLNTLYHVYPDFRTKEQAGSLGTITKLFDIMAKYIYEKDTALPGQVLLNPITYEARGEIAIPRDKLPSRGLLMVWLPLPLVTAAQPNVESVSVYPEKYIKFPHKLDGDIGLTYMEIPLEEIEGDLTIGTKFRLTHFEERFNVDPAKVGEYDKNSTLYKRYTASGKNIAITPAIRAAAKKIAGQETNPYLIAKKYYDHVVYDLDYSLTPHPGLEALGIPESVFVHEHRYGDCGAQSIYFSALCRSMGIPARASGGLQLFPSPRTGCGDHFWAQIYLPNYGWIPVDTSVGQLAKYMPNLREEQRRDFIEYFFGNLDPFRYLIQVDVDIPLIPKPDESLIFEMVLQQPTALCREMNRNPGLLFMEDWNIVFKPVSDAD